MGKRARRQSQNTRYMQQILMRLREYDLEEVRILCQKYMQQKGRTPPSTTEDDKDFDFSDDAEAEPVSP